MKKEIKEEYMKLAIEKAKENLIKQDGGPFGACIVRGKEVLAVEKNKVLKEDATSHAEINAIRAASKKIENFNLEGSVIYSTTEPCPMCFSAIYWARIGALVYGTKIEDAAASGFNELSISNDKLNEAAEFRVEIYPGFLAEECKKLFFFWDKLPHKRFY